MELTFDPSDEANNIIVPILKYGFVIDRKYYDLQPKGANYYCRCNNNLPLIYGNEVVLVHKWCFESRGITIKGHLLMGKLTNDCCILVPRSYILPRYTRYIEVLSIKEKNLF